MTVWIDLHNEYSLYEHLDDIRYENDLQELKREVIRQRIFIEQQAAEINRLRLENGLLDGMRSLRRNFSDA